MRENYFARRGRFIRPTSGSDGELHSCCALPVSERAEADYYRNYAFVILNTLLGPDFLANETPGWEGILKHGIYHERKKLGVDVSVMWGEYFFLSALDKALRLAR